MSVIDEEQQQDNVYANRTDHEEGLWENIHIHDQLLTSTLPLEEDPGPTKKNFTVIWGLSHRKKILIVHSNWNDVQDDLKKLIWEDILVMSTVATRWRQFKFSLTSKFVYANNEGQEISDPTVKYGIDPATWAEFAKSRQTPNWQGIRKKAQEIQKYNDFPHLLSRGGYELLDKKLMEEKRKRIDPLSPVSRQEKWKMTRTSHYGQMTSAAAKEVADKIDSLEQQATQGSFVPHGREDILNTPIGRPEHLGHVRVARTGVTISQYLRQTSRGSSTSSPSITQAQLVDIIGGLKDEVQREVEEEHKQMQEAWRRELEAEHK
ncbi:hypothetical protein HKD37_12G033783 [Glycine soja]